MKLFLFLLPAFTATLTSAFAQKEKPRQSLNNYVAFLSQSSEVALSRFEMLQTYQGDVKTYRSRPGLGLRLSSSGPPEVFYFNKALASNGLAASEKKALDAAANALWATLNELDETAKALETYVRLKEFQDDHLHKSDELVSRMLSIFPRFNQEKTAFYNQIQRIYLKYQTYSADDPWLVTEKAMEEVLVSQEKLLALLPYFPDENTPNQWPADQVKQSMLEDGKLLETIGNTASKLGYPASSALLGFKESLGSMQAAKARALDAHNFVAGQSARHGNEVYLSLLKLYNQDLLARHKLFVGNAQVHRQLLLHPAFSPVATLEKQVATRSANDMMPPFADKPLQTFVTKLAPAPADAATIRTLNQYIDFINESLRQMHLLQIILRNYQSAA